tara:strand:- start:2254 stop:3987 length:1734 start_codon:yes stop_codon:yes gene_type:complete
MTNKVYLFQPQHAIFIKGVENYWLPYAIGCLWSYACKHTEGFELGEIIFKREDPSKVLDRIDDPAVCVFSTYIWNEQYNLYLARLIKNKFPDCVIEFGGPQSTKSLIEKDFIDCVILGEGEEPFVDMLDRIKNKKELKNVYEREQLKELSYVSPYTSGIFDDIVRDNPEYHWSALVESTRGCPHHCTFCDWGTWMDKIKKFDLTQVEADINWMSTHKVGFLMMADANFGIFKERDLLIARMLRKAADHPLAIIDDLTVQYTKNSTDVVFDISKALGPYDRRGVSMSVQSMNTPTLKAVRRQNNTLEKAKQFVQKARDKGVNVYTEMILGLPEETVESWKDGLCDLLASGQDSIDIWFCQVFGNTELNLNRDKYGIKVVNATDYVSFTNKEDSIKEVVEIVNQTDTMTTEELVEAYLYAWMVIMFHINGFSHVLSEYSDLTYREYYDNMFECLKNDTGLFGNHFKEITERITTYLTTGKLISNKDRGHTLELGMGTDFDLFWNNKPEVFNFIKTILPVSQSLFELQQKTVYDPKTEYPFTIKHNKEFYIIDNPRSDEERDDIWVLKRKNLLKNKLIKP